MGKGRFVVKRVPATTNNITQAIINFLKFEGHAAKRINSTGIWDEEKQIFRSSPGTRGALDIAATLKTTSGLGLAHWVDVKKGKDRVRADQATFIAEQRAAGAICCTAKTIDEYKQIYYDEIKPKLLRL